MNYIDQTRERPEKCRFSRGHRKPFLVLRGAWGQHRANGPAREGAGSGPCTVMGACTDRKASQCPVPISHG